MSEYYDDEEDFVEEDFENGDDLSEAEIMAIQEEYRRRRLIESLIGPVISTIFHVGLIIILAIFITDKYKQDIPEIEVTMEEPEEIKIEEPPPVEEPEPVEEAEDVVNPVLTTVALEVDTNDAALEDTNDEAPSTDDDSTVEAVSDVIVSPSAFASPSVFGGRSAAGRASSVAKFGGSRAGQQKLMNALYWLKKVQNPNGSWALDPSIQQGLTGLALLTFLAHGETPTSKEFGTTVQKAMEWLAMSPMDTGAKHAYPHAIKAYALAEAYAMTGISILEDAMNRSIRIIIDGQNERGCFNYNYNKHNRDDLSFGGWNYQALKAAYGAGCQEEGLMGAIYKSIDWLKAQGGSSDDGKGYAYVIENGEAKQKGKHTMRAVGVLCLQLFGEGSTPEIKDEIETIATDDLQKLSWNTPVHASLYSWYYATQAMFQHGGPQWKAWNRKFQKEVGDNQHKEGYWQYPSRGYGVANQPDTLDSKIYATTLCALMLTVYYRYLPSTKGAIGSGAAKKEEKKPAMEEEGLDLID